MPPKKQIIPPVAGLDTGSTRLRVFKALKRYHNGLTVLQIKGKCALLPKSGHLSLILPEEIERKRIRREEHMVANAKGVERKITVYVLTAKGKKDLEAGQVDGNGYAGQRIGRSWTETQAEAHKS